MDSVIRSSRPEVFFKKGVPENFTNQSLLFNNVAALRLATVFKKRLWRWYFPVSFVKFLRTPFLTENLWWLLLCNSGLKYSECKCTSSHCGFEATEFQIESVHDGSSAWSAHGKVNIK